MRTPIRAFLISAALALPVVTVIGLSPDIAHAGPEAEEIWFGTGASSLETGDNGKLTAEGAKTRTKEVDRIPGEDDWELNLHARLNGHAAEGPLYVEFYQEVNGEQYIVWRYEEPDFDGNRDYSATMVLEANIGFNKDRDYRVIVIQNNGKRDVTLAKGKVRLIDTGREPDLGDDGGDAGGDDEGGDDGPSEQDIADTLVGGDEDDDDGGDGEAPPPIEETPTTKKGCSVGGVDVGFSGTAILLLLALATRRRED